MGSLIGMLVGRKILGQVIGEKGARAIAYAGLALLIIIVLATAKCAYDRSVIAKHEASERAATAKADRKADAKAAEQRRVDDARLSTETAEIKEAVNEAGSDPAARRAAYYRCIELQQSARAKGKPPAAC